MKKVLLFLMAMTLVGVLAFAEEGSGPCGVKLCDDPPWSTNPRLLERQTCEQLGMTDFHNFKKYRCCFKNYPDYLNPEEICPEWVAQHPGWSRGGSKGSKGSTKTASTKNKGTKNSVKVTPTAKGVKGSAKKTK